MRALKELEGHIQYPANREEVSDMLRRHGVLPTRQRMEITWALFSRRTHMSADQLLHTVNLEHSESSKATIYNTLKLLLEKGLVREVIVDPERVFYDPNTGPHHHFYNVESGELIDIDPDTVHLTGMPSPPPGTVMDYVDVIIRIRPTTQQSQSPL